MDLINKCTLAPLKEEDVFVYKVVLCDNEVDRVGDKMSPEFLEAVASKIKGVVGLKDHDWSADNQLSRLYDAEVVTSETEVNSLGEPRMYVRGKAYTLSKYSDYIQKINAGLLKEVSISFESEGDTCSICGCPTTKDFDGRACCKNGHVAGYVYDGKLCYNNITKLKDILEWSLVPVPCQKGAGISKKSINGKEKGLMRKVEYLIKNFMTSKAYESATAEEKASLESVIDTDASVELSAEEIEHLIAENHALKNRVHELEEALEDAKGAANKERVALEVDKALEGAGLVFPEIKGLLTKELPLDSFVYQDGHVEGLDDAIKTLKETYKSCFKSAVPEEGQNKTTFKSSGITLGMSQKSYENKETTVKKKTGLFLN